MCKYVVFFFVRKHEYIDIARRPNGLFKAYPYIVYKRYFIAFLHYKVKRNKFEGGGTILYLVAIFVTELVANVGSRVKFIKVKW